jgi:hypothetical protein
MPLFTIRGGGGRENMVRLIRLDFGFEINIQISIKSSPMIRCEPLRFKDPQEKNPNPTETIPVQNHPSDSRSMTASRYPPLKFARKYQLLSSKKRNDL